MKRFWLVLLSLGLIMAFSASAFAVDVKVSGSYYAAGVYLDKAYLDKSNVNALGWDGQSTAFYFQRLRVGTELVVAPGLSVITRFDALERVFGSSRTTGTTTGTSTAAGTAYTGTTSYATQPGSAGTWGENENIAFDYVYIKYAAPIGTFQVGAQPGGTYGTIFNDGEEPRYRVKYISPDYNGFVWTAVIEKNTENSYWNSDHDNLAYTGNNGYTDADMNTYYLTGDYKTKNFATGILYGYTVDNTFRPASTTAILSQYQGQYHTFNPYATAVFGPVKLQAELKWIIGKYEAEVEGNRDRDVESFGGWIDAVATFGQFYVGGTFAYAQGDADATDDTIRDRVNGGRDWSPTLIMWNQDRAMWAGNINTLASAALGNDGFDQAFANAFLYQLRVGVKPVEKLDICFAASYAQRDKVPSVAGIGDAYKKDLGWEFDLTGTYKITNNLSYLLGAGYLITGDYFKGPYQVEEVTNNYMVINKLTLTF